MVPDKFCIVPWIHLNTEPDGKVKPCCVFDTNIDEYKLNLKTHSLEEVWNHDLQKNIRKQFLNNEVPAGCKSCVLREDSGAASYRTHMNKEFHKSIIPAIENTKNDGHYDKFELLYWDFRLSNFCNFKCRMCGHALSSSWYEETPNSYIPHKIIDSKLHGKDLMKYVDQFIDVVEEVYFAGGEPLILAEHYQIIDKLIEKERFDVRLRYSTNLSTLDYKSYDIVSAWKKFKNITIYPSLDGMGAVAEYNRHGTDWSRVENNLIRLLEANIPVSIACVVNVYTAFDLPNFLDRLIDINFKLKYHFNVNVLTFPSWQSISILSPELKQQLKMKYSSHLNTLDNENKEIIQEFYNQIYFFLDSEASKDDQLYFVEETARRDQYRNENILDIVPEYKDWIDQLKKEK